MWGMKTFGQKFRESREAAELTQSDIAKACHTDKQSVSNWERDANWPSTENLILALKRIGRTNADANYILGLSEKNEIPFRLDIATLAEAIAAVDMILHKRKRKKPSPEEYARLIMGLYPGIPEGAELPMATVVPFGKVQAIEGNHGEEEGSKEHNQRRDKGNRQKRPEKKKA